jgi:hypothetical protein
MVQGQGEGHVSSLSTHLVDPRAEAGGELVRKARIAPVVDADLRGALEQVPASSTNSSLTRT